MERETISLRSALKRADAELRERSDECERLRDELRSKGAARFDHLRRGSNRHRGASTSTSPSSGDSDGDECAVRRGGDSNARVEKLERENRELKQANEILRKASAFFAQAELGRRSK